MQNASCNPSSAKNIKKYTKAYENNRINVVCRHELKLSDLLKILLWQNEDTFNVK